MLVDGMSYLEEYPRLVIAPGLALTMVVVSFNLLGEHFALQKVPRALNPRRLRKLKRERLGDEAEIQAKEVKA